MALGEWGEQHSPVLHQWPGLVADGHLGRAWPHSHAHSTPEAHPGYGVDTSPEIQGQRKGVPLAVLRQVAPSSNNLQFREEMWNLVPFFFLCLVFKPTPSSQETFQFSGEGKPVTAWLVMDVPNRCACTNMQKDVWDYWDQAETI